MTEERVCVTTTYYRDETGEARIRVTAGHSVLYDQPNYHFFVDTEQMKPWFEIDTSKWTPYPWEKEAVKQ